MQFFDCCASFRISMVPSLKRADKVTDLLAEMNRWGVSDALVFHAAMRDDSPIVGNELLVRAITERPRLHDTWAILPPQTGELDTPEKFITQMKKLRDSRFVDLSYKT